MERLSDLNHKVDQLINIPICTPLPDVPILLIVELTLGTDQSITGLLLTDRQPLTPQGFIIYILFIIKSHQLT